MLKANGHVIHLQAVCSGDYATDVVFTWRQFTSVDHVQEAAKLLRGNHSCVDGDGVGAIQERPDGDSTVLVLSCSVIKANSDCSSHLYTVLASILKYDGSKHKEHICNSCS